jgi:hypothetical protein
MAPNKVRSHLRYLATNPTYSAQMNPMTHKDMLDMLYEAENRNPSRDYAVLPQRFKAQTLMRSDNAIRLPGTDRGSPPDAWVLRFSSPPPTAAPIETSGESLPDYEPAEYVDEEETDAELPGTAAYYKTRKFQHKKAAGKVQMPGKAKNWEASESSDASNEKEKPKKLIMIFGKTNVRRANVNKYTARVQRSNKRV